MSASIDAQGGKLRLRVALSRANIDVDVFRGDKILVCQWPFLGTNCGAPYTTEGVLVSYGAGSIYGAAIERRGRAESVFWYHLMASGRCAPVFLSLSPPFSALPDSSLTLRSPPPLPFPPVRRILSLYFMDSSPPRPRVPYIYHKAISIGEYLSDI